MIQTQEQEGEEDTQRSIILSSNDLLSLYTEIDEVQKQVKSTRSVIINKSNTNTDELVVIDNVTFTLYISIPIHVRSLLLKKWMVNSYCYRHYQNPYSDNNDTATLNNLFVIEKNNKMISNDTKSILQHIDNRNYYRFKSHIDNGRKKYKHYGNNKEDEEDDEDKDNITECDFDKDMDIVKGLYTKKSNEQDEENNEDEEEENDDIYINTDLTRMHNTKDIEKIFRGQKQFKLTFNNHCILNFFINRFKVPVTLRSSDGDNTFTVNVVDYENDPKNVRYIRPVVRIFKGLPSQYIESQLLQFKNNDDKITVYFPHSRVIKFGLLHPSYMEAYSGIGSSYNSRNFNNTLDNMFKMKKEAEKKNTFAYQTFYINLYEIPSSYTIYTVDYTQKKSTFSLTRVVVSSNEKNNKINDMRNKPIEKKQEPQKPTIAIKQIKNQPRLMDFVFENNNNIIAKPDFNEDIPISTKNKRPLPVPIISKSPNKKLKQQPKLFDFISENKK